MNRVIIILAFIVSFTSALGQRGQVHESDWRDPEDSGDTSWTFILIFFGAIWIISEIIKSREENKK